MQMKKVRLDQLVFDLGLTESRERAKTTIMSGLVFVNGQRADKPGMPVAPDANVEVRGEAIPFVSRGGFKLDKALKVFPIDPAGKICIDCGASTGGFTDVLLQHGAAKVYSVDVGYGQLAWKLRIDPRVVNLERTNLRYVTEKEIPEAPSLAVMDVSFISIKLVLPAVAALIEDGADIMCLIKPQFEAGREKVGKGGIVRDPEVHKEVIRDTLKTFEESGYFCWGLTYSPIKGGSGNIEFLTYLRSSIPQVLINDEDINAVVEEAHNNLLKGQV